jgi:molybdopterin-containing oxidoreductase family membrane subunit
VPALVVVAVLVNIGMFYERYVIIITSLARSFDPFSWKLYHPTWVEMSILLGSFAWFFLLFLLFAKTFPVVSMWEVKELLPLPKKEGTHAA